MSIGTILLITAVFVISMFSKAKKAMEEQAAPQGHPAVPGNGDADNAETFETPSDENPYFTYESDTEEIAKTHRAPKAQAAVMISVADQPVARPQFDLRQAVIHQVILDNRYIDEINQ